MIHSSLFVGYPCDITGSTSSGTHTIFSYLRIYFLCKFCIESSQFMVISFQCALKEWLCYWPLCTQPQSTMEGRQGSFTPTQHIVMRCSHLLNSWRLNGAIDFCSTCRLICWMNRKSRSTTAVQITSAYLPSPPIWLTSNHRARSDEMQTGERKCSSPCSGRTSRKVCW